MVLNRKLARTCVVLAVGIATSVIGLAPAAAAPAWSFTPNPSANAAPTANLTAVACPTATVCLAVGLTTPSPLVQLVAERWNGTAWSLVPIATPSPAWTPETVINDISCVGPTNCFVVGSSGEDTTRTPLMEHWNGTAWSIVNVPAPASAGSSGIYLTGVSCVGPTFCFATGNRVVSPGNATPYGLRWNGTTWTLTSFPKPAGAVDVSIDAISCPATTTCFAVGHQSKESGSTSAHTLVERWNGSGWSIQASPTPSVLHLTVNDVSCAMTTSCFAVGGYQESSGTIHQFSLRGNGTTWSVVAIGSASGGALAARVRCVSPSNCYAVGSRYDPQSGLHTWLQHWNGTSWVVADHPTVAHSEFGDVACANASVCMAVGDYEPTSPGQTVSPGALTLTERWNGTAWSVAPIPSGGSRSQLALVSCPTTTFCLALGYATGPGTVSLLTKRWNGTTWTIVPTPTPPGSSRSTLSGISCTSATFCLAVGVYSAGSSYRILTERWNGSAWSVVSTASNPNAHLEAVSCRSSANCTATGTVNDHRVIERWNGSTWTVSNTLAGLNKDLESISCPTTTNCMAVGWTYVGTSFARQTFARQWNGTTWSTVPTPNPSAAEDPILSSVSCPSPTNCVAIGSFSSGPDQEPLIERWNGSAWSIDSLPVGDGEEIELRGVSCASVTSCVAIGSSSSSGTLIEQWDGAAWTVASNDPRAGYLQGVSCASPANCTAVGRAPSLIYEYTTIEQYR